MTNISKIQVTDKGLIALKKELKDLVEKDRPRVVKRLGRARGEGDLKENSDYHSAKDELEFLDGRIDELRHVVDYAQVVGDGGSTDQVSVGTRVTVRNGDGVEHIFDIVGQWEADPIKKKISHESPLGKALVDRKIGDKVQVEAPAGNIVYEILKVE